MSQKLEFILVLLILLFSQQSNASLIPMFRKLSQGENPKEKHIQIPPSISPVSSVNSNSSVAPVDNFDEERSQNVQVPANSPKAEPIDTITNERCGLSSNSCKDDKNMTACLSYAGNGPQVPFLIVQNDGENSLKVNFTFLPVKNTFEELELSKHQAKKMQINISANLGGIKSIVLNAGNGNCTIQMRSSAPENNFYKHFQSYATYATPIHGAYLLFLMAIIIGGIWACCKLGKGDRHLDGVPYQELEMGQPGSLSTMNADTEGWDQGWDDDWDEEKAVKSPGGNHVGNGRANGLASRSSDNDGWGNDWDD